ncbi:MAG: chemotaxis protein CheW [Pseudomonadota bacterium]
MQDVLARPLEVLSFTLGHEQYGIDIQKVQELRQYEQPTRLANAPPHILGVMDLRGTIVPIIDMRIKFGQSAPAYNAMTVVIVLTIVDRMMGIVVDSVSDVTTLAPEQIRPAPQLGASVRTDYVLGIGTVEDRMLILVDIDRVLSPEELEGARAVHA